MNKIYFFLPHLAAGGAERVLINIMNICNASHKSELVVVADKGELESFIDEKIHVNYFKLKRTLYSLGKVFLFLYKNDVKIAFSTTHRMNVVISLCSLLLKNTTSVVRLPNSPILEFESGAMSLFNKYVFGFCYRQADYVIAQTEQMKREAITLFGIKEQNIHVVSNPVDTKNILYLSEKSSVPFNSNVINIVASGRLTEQKGFEYLIEAFSIFTKNNPNSILHILGKDISGVYKQHLELISRKFKVENKVVFHGLVSNPYAFYKSSDMFVLSSLWEGFPNVVLENLVLQKTIVATNCVEEISKFISDGVNGYVVPPRDSIALAKAMTKAISLNNTSLFENNNSDVSCFVNKLLSS